MYILVWLFITGPSMYVWRRIIIRRSPWRGCGHVCKSATMAPRTNWLWKGFKLAAGSHYGTYDGLARHRTGITGPQACWYVLETVYCNVNQCLNNSVHSQVCVVVRLKTSRQMSEAAHLLSDYCHVSNLLSSLADYCHVTCLRFMW